MYDEPFFFYSELLLMFNFISTESTQYSMSSGIEFLSPNRKANLGSDADFLTVGRDEREDRPM